MRKTNKPIKYFLVGGNSKFVEFRESKKLQW